MITTQLIRIYSRILNAFENDSGSPESDYRSIYVYHDGNGKRKQVTLARGFTQDGGSLWKVIQRYIDKGGKQSEFFKSYKLKMSDGSLWQDPAFHKALQDASVERSMQEAQEEIFTEVYMNPALQWAERHGFQLPLSVGVIVDSYLHSGSVPSWITNKFPEVKPDDGGDEKGWTIAYLNARLNWLGNASTLLRNTIYRPKFFLDEIRRNNWSLNCPLIANGSKIC